MSKAIRQENLYGAEDWSVVYTSFKNAEFQSYDFDTLRQSMVDYMQVYYAEEFNDYIQSSEFIALLDLVAYVGQNLAFRMDLNARENILDTAEKRESVLRIARMLSYKPKRVRPAQGLLKVVSVMTTENVMDSLGRDLSNVPVSWGFDPSDIEYDRFIRIINAAFNSRTKFGTPSGRTVNSTDGSIFETYAFNNSEPIINAAVSLLVDGADFNFDLVSITVDANGSIAESEPDYNAAFNIGYRNDGKGVGSSRTGFFVLAKQGYTVSKDVIIGSPQSSLVIDLEGTSNISEDDFTVQTVDAGGNVLTTWTRVGTLDASNIVVNEVGTANRNLYEVIYSSSDVTSIKFGDGTFTNVPSGSLKIWYRLAEDSYVRVKAGEMSQVSFNMNYLNANGSQHTLTLLLDLQDNMTTGIPSETIAEIKNNAPEVFYSKNRMVSGDDYNGLLPTLNNNVLLMHSENRTFAGHSRYVDLSDPTGKSRPLMEMADDGYLYREESLNSKFIADSNISNEDLIDNHIESCLSDVTLMNFYYGMLDLTDSDDTLFKLQVKGTQSFVWNLAYSDSSGSNGYITAANSRVPERLGFAASGFLRSVRPGSILKIGTGTEYTWATVLDVRGDGLGVQNINEDSTGVTANGMGTVELNKVITAGSEVLALIPPLPRLFDQIARQSMLANLNSKTSFSLIFNNAVPNWTVLSGAGNNLTDFDMSNPSRAWIINVVRDNVNAGWTIFSKQLTYVFGSESQIRFYNINFLPSFNTSFKNTSNDVISVIGLENNKFVTTESYGISGYYTYVDGYTDNSKVKISPLDLDNNFLPDNPENFEDIVGNDKFDLVRYEEGDFTYLVPQQTVGAPLAEKTVRGTTNISFKWKHTVPSDQTLNPSLTNIIDAYVLTKTYYQEYKQWKNNNITGTLPMPLPPTTEELRNEFRDISSYKMLTDEVIFHPAKFKPVFGAQADQIFRATFKVVKSPASKLTDNEVKSKVIAAIDSFFEPGNFNFGETFYFTELSTYIHTKLSSDISSVVIVPSDAYSAFGTLFQIDCDRDEIIISIATVNDITIINELTNKNIRISK